MDTECSRRSVHAWANNCFHETRARCSFPFSFRYEKAIVVRSLLIGVALCLCWYHENIWSSSQGRKSYKEEQRMSRLGEAGRNCTYAPHAGNPSKTCACMLPPSQPVQSVNATRSWALHCLLIHGATESEPC